MLLLASVHYDSLLVKITNKITKPKNQFSNTSKYELVLERDKCRTCYSLRLSHRSNVWLN